MGKAGITLRVVQVLCLWALVCGGARATAQTQANVTPWLFPQLGDPNTGDTPGLAVVQNVVLHSGDPAVAPDIALQCAPADTNVSLLEFSLYTRNDGYADLSFNYNDPNDSQFFNLDPRLPGVELLTNFATFSLIDAVTSTAATRTGDGGTQVPITGIKELFGLTSDDTMPYRGDHPPKTNQGGIPDLVTWGWYDDYAIGFTPCQYLRIDGLTNPSGHDLDLIVEENAPRLMNCDLPTVDQSNCRLDGRVYDNAAAVRFHLDASGNLTFPPPVVDTGITTIGPQWMVGPPAVVVRGVNAYDLFYAFNDGNIYMLHQDSLTPWSAGVNGTQIASFTGSTPTSTAAISTDRTRTDIFTVMTNGDVGRVSNDGTTGYVASTYGRAATGWGAVSPPAVAPSGPKSAMVTWVNPESIVISGTFDGTNWGTPAAFEGLTAANQTPALASSGDGMFHLFVIDEHGAVQYNRFFGGAWGSFRSIPGVTAVSGLAARLGVKEDQIPGIYLSAVDWASALRRGTPTPV